MMYAIFLILIFPLCLGQSCSEEDCSNLLDIPLVSKVDAPLKAEIDVSLLVNQLRQQLKKALNASLSQTVPDTIETIINERMKDAYKTCFNYSIVASKNIKEMNVTLHAFLKELIDRIDQRMTESVTDLEAKFNEKFDNFNKRLAKTNDKLDQIRFVSRPRDCSDLDGSRDKSGVYKIYPDNGLGFYVYCDMTTDGGGWTVIINRFDGSESFERNWVSYENGFGNLTKEFWLGNKYINRVTASGNFQVRVDLESFKEEKGYAKYSTFGVGDSESNYELTVSGYSGNAGDSLSYHNSRPFTTGDRDHDSNHKGNCASGKTRKGSGWWYGSCEVASLTLQYGNGDGKESYGHLMQWEKWSLSPFAIKSASMMIQRI